MDSRLYPSNSRKSSPFSHYQRVSASLTPASSAGDTGAEQTFAVAGLKLGDVIVCNPPAPGNALGFGGCSVSAVDEVQITFLNNTAGALTWGAGTFDFMIFRPVV